MTDWSAELILLLLIWGALCTIIVIVALRRRTVGLAIGFVVSLSLIHALGALVHALPWSQFARTETVFVGFAISLIGLIGFAVGNLLVAPHLFRERVSRRPLTGSVLSRAIRTYFFVGLVCYVLFFTPVTLVPSMTSVVSAGQNLVLVAMCLACWRALQTGRRPMFWLLLAGTAIFPLFTVLSQGFLGYGTMAAVAVLAFATTIYRPRWRMVALCAVLSYLGLVVFDGYMADRNDIRAAVWGGKSLERRIEVVKSTLSNLKPLELHDEDFLAVVDVRLNQNYLVGSAVEYTAQTGEYADGETIWMAVLALVPRILWPEKHVVAGSMGLVSEYTGISFAYGTSVGMGYVLELFINFRNAGVILGFLILGLIVGVLDRQSRRCLDEGDAVGFAQRFLPALSLLNVGGSFVGISAAVAAAALLVWVVNHLAFVLATGPTRTHHESTSTRATAKAL